MTKNEVSASRDDRGFFPFYWCFRTVLRAAYLLLWRWRRIGRERMPETGPVIIASNHASYLDPTILGSVYDRPVGFMARRSLFRGIFGFLIRKLYAFPVDREGDPRSAMRIMGERLGRGECVVMFPEGTRTRDGRLGEIKRGIGMLAVRHRATVLPTYIGGSFESWPRHAKVLRPHPLRIETGEPIVPRDCGKDRAARKAEERRIQEEVERQLHELEERHFRATGKALKAPESQATE